MIPAQNYDVTLSSGIKATNSASIAMTPEVFDILSSKIYKDKVMAVIREIICNARDACVENNTTQPIVVHLPTYLDRTFYVRDYGKGLSKQAAMDLYLSYGVSTKTASNDLIGGMGIGSKSPFAYTTQFTVESFHNGEKHTFLVYKDKGIPCISFTGTVKSSEPTGLKVSLSVNSYDTNEFTNKFRAFGRFFDYPLQSPSGEKYEFNQNLSVIVDNEHCTVYKKEQNSYDENYYVVMGGVAYTISTNYFDKFFEVVSRNDKNGFFIVVKADIGELSVAASRETLSEDDDTVEKLKYKIEKLTETFVDHIKESIKDLNDHMLVRKLACFASNYNFTQRVVEVAKRFGLTNFDGEAYVKELSSIRLNKIGSNYHDLFTFSCYQSTDASQYFISSGKYEKILVNKLKRVGRKGLDICIVRDDQKALINKFYGVDQVYHSTEEAAELFQIQLKSSRKKVAGVKRKYQGVYDLADSPVNEIEDDCEGFYIPTDRGTIDNDLKIGAYTDYISRFLINFFKDTLILKVGKSSINIIKKNTKMKELNLEVLKTLLKTVKISKEEKRFILRSIAYNKVFYTEEKVYDIRKKFFTKQNENTSFEKYFNKIDPNHVKNTNFLFSSSWDEVNRMNEFVSFIYSYLPKVKLDNLFITEVEIENIVKEETEVLKRLEKDFGSLIKTVSSYDFFNLVNTIIPDYTNFVTNRKTN